MSEQTQWIEQAALKYVAFDTLRPGCDGSQPDDWKADRIKTEAGDRRRWAKLEHGDAEEIHALLSSQFPGLVCKVITSDTRRAETARLLFVARPDARAGEPAPRVGGPGLPANGGAERTTVVAPGPATRDKTPPPMDQSGATDDGGDWCRVSHFERFKALADRDIELVQIKMRQEHDRAIQEREAARTAHEQAEANRHARLLEEISQRHQQQQQDARETFERLIQTEREQAERLRAQNSEMVDTRLEQLTATLSALEKENRELSAEADGAVGAIEEMQQKALALAQEKPEDLQGWIMHQIQQNPEMVKKLVATVTEKLAGETGAAVVDTVAG